jgi:TPR repeat protein
MKKRDFVFMTAASALVCPAWVAAQTKGINQTALVIGNNAYQGSARLTNATRDAALMHETFKKLGANSALRTDLTTAELAKEIDAFIVSFRRQQVDIAWFFYSGHGAHIDGNSLLLGTNVAATTPEQVKDRSYNLDKLKGALDLAKPQVAVIVIDACRDNPFQPQPPSKTRGLRTNPGMIPSKWGGSLTAYSTAPYTVAQDWPDQANGPYAKALSKALLAQPPRLIEEAFKAAADEVYVATKREQRPGFYSDLRSKVLLSAEQTTISPGTISVAALPSGKPSQTASRSYVQGYRADLLVDDKYADVGRDEWATTTYELELAVKKMDRFEAADALASARRAAATDKELLVAGLLHEQGLLTTKNRKAAAGHYEKAALRGHVTAQTLLGELEFERQNYAESYKWLSLAANSGWGRPTLDLAQLTLAGKGVAQDPKQAIDLMLEAFRAIPKTQLPTVPINKP